MVLGNLNSALAQGFSWDRNIYYDQENKERVNLEMTEEEYNTLVIRYGEVACQGNGPGNKIPELDFNYTIIEKTSKIDYEYMNKNFDKYIKALFDTSASMEDIENLKVSLHKNFASLPKDRQVLAEMIINDLESRDLKIVDGWNFNDYINEYSISKLDKQINSIVEFTEIGRAKLKNFYH